MAQGEVTFNCKARALIKLLFRKVPLFWHSLQSSSSIEFDSPS